MIAVLWVPWSLGGIGGGDVKLAAAAVIWAGYELVIPFVIVGAVAGGFVAVGAYALSRPEARSQIRRNLLLAAIVRRWPEAPSIDNDRKSGRISVPYALAILAGATYIVLAPRYAWPH